MNIVHGQKPTKVQGTQLVIDRYLVCSSDSGNSSETKTNENTSGHDEYKIGFDFLGYLRVRGWNCFKSRAAVQDSQPAHRCEESARKINFDCTPKLG